MWDHYYRLGNVMDLTDENGNLSASFDKDAFGNVLEGNSEGYHLTTKEYNPNIGLYYFFQRWYDPYLGRFIKRAPHPPQMEEQYGYCNNNPVKRIDPQGRLSAEEERSEIEDCFDKSKDDCETKGACHEFADCMCSKQGKIQQCLAEKGVTLTHCKIERRSTGPFHGYCFIQCDDFIACRGEDFDNPWGNFPPPTFWCFINLPIIIM